MLPEWFHQLGIMGWPLAVCSVAALAIGMERAVFTFRNYARRLDTYDTLKKYLQEHKDTPKVLRDDMVSMALAELQTSYSAGIKWLRMIGTISPMLGLLGTILGIISAFKVIAAQTGPVTPNVIADGLWEAMLTTAAGLFIALPALLMAHVFRHCNEKILQDFSSKLNRLSVQYELEKHSGSGLHHFQNPTKRAA